MRDFRTQKLKKDMKKSIFLVACLSALAATAQQKKQPVQKREASEFYKDFPKYADRLLQDLTYPLAWGNSSERDLDRWREQGRRKVRECMMTPPPPPKHGWQTQLLAEEQREGYRAMLLELNLSDYYRVKALLLVPDGAGPFPAVNALHDHGAHLYIGKEKMIRPLTHARRPDGLPWHCDTAVVADADRWAESLYEGQYVGDYLARQGYVVLSTDAPMWGERGREEGVDRSRYDLIAGNMMMYGVDLSAYMTYDDIAATDFLASLPWVDADRIACVGCSMGAYRAWMLSALSDRVRVGCAVCWMVTTDVQMTWAYGRKENGGFANCIPGLRRWMDYPHIASLAAPKPMLFINGRQDKLFPVPGVEKAFAQMREVWHAAKADSCLATELWDMPHACPKKAQQRMLDFLKRHL